PLFYCDRATALLHPFPTRRSSDLSASAPAPTPPAEPAAPIVAEDKRIEADLPLTGTWLGAVLAGALALLGLGAVLILVTWRRRRDRKSTRLNSSHVKISYAVFCLK